MSLAEKISSASFFKNSSQPATSGFNTMRDYQAWLSPKNNAGWNTTNRKVANNTLGKIQAEQE